MGIWTMSKDIAFDNFIVANNEDAAVKFARETFDVKLAQAKANQPSIMEKAKKAADENKWIVYVVTGVLGLIVLVIFWNKKKAAPEEDTGELNDGSNDAEEKKVEDEPEAEQEEEEEEEEEEKK